MKSFNFPEKVLAHHVGIIGKAGSGKTVTAKGIAEMLLERKERICVIDPTGVWWGLKSSADGKKPAFPVLIFGGEHADVPISERHGEAIAELVGTTSTPVIIDTRLMRVSERTRFFADFAENILRFNKGALNLFIDEAHLFAPQGRVADPQSAKMLHAANNLVSTGRARGLRVTLISQRPAKLHKDSLTQVETLVAMRLIAPQDRKAMEEWIADQADVKQGREIIASLPTMKTGTGWIWSPEVGILEQVSFPMIKTFDSSRAPNVLEKGPKPVLATINAVMAQESLKTFEQEAKANDPNALKKRIKELEAKQGGASKAELDALQKEAWADGRKVGHADGFKHGWDKAFAKVREFLSQADDFIPPEQGTEIPKEFFIKKSYSSAEKTPSITMEIQSPLPMNVMSIKQKGIIGMPNAQDKVAKAIGFWHSIGTASPRREQVAAVAGYSPTSGGFNNLIGAMRTAGIVEIPEAGCVKLTYFTPQVSMTMKEARAKMFGFLSNAQAKILEGFRLDAELSRTTLADRTGYSPTSGGFNNLIGSLCSLKILEKPRTGCVAISEWVLAILEE